MILLALDMLFIDSDVTLARHTPKKNKRNENITCMQQRDETSFQEQSSQLL